MGFCYRAVIWATRDSDLEFARQELKFRMISGPLAQKLRRGAGVFDFIGGSARKMVCGDVAHAVARGLNGVHFHIGQRRKNGGHILQHRPVVLDVLARGEMAIALVIGVSDHCQLPHLARRKRAVGNGHAQHIGVQLQIEAVHQAQRAKFILGQ